MSKHILIANWKMYLSPDEAYRLAYMYGTQFNELCKEKKVQCVLCPSTEALARVHNACAGADAIALAAQDCSSSTYGAYTGQSAAVSLKQVGCSFVLIGHSEVRAQGTESDTVLEKKVYQALNAELSPIFCVGETAQERETGNVSSILKKQLEPLKKALSASSLKAHQKIFIAYEPIWAIGSGIIVDEQTLKFVIDQLKSELSTSALDVQFLYGGSIDPQAATWLWQISHLNGLLVGKASTDFQLMKKIVGYKQ